MTLRSTLSILVSVASLHGAGVSPDEMRTWALGQVAFLSQRNSSCVDHSPGFGLSAGVWLRPRWGWEAAYLHSSLESKGHLWKAGEDHLDVTALFRPLLHTGRWIPFVRAGAGFSRLETPLALSARTSTRSNLTVGAGAFSRIEDQGLISLELRSVTVMSSTRRQEFEVLVGIGRHWGAPPRARVSAPAPIAETIPMVPVPLPVSPEPPPPAVIEPTSPVPVVLPK